MPRFAANLSTMFTEHAFLDRFAAAADAGFEAVEYLFPYDFPAEAVAARLRASGLEQALFNMPPGDWGAGDRGFAALPDRRAAFEASLRTALRYAEAIGTPLLHMMAGCAAWDDPAAQAAFRERALRAADAAASRGVGVVIEPLNRRDMPGYFLSDFEGAAALVRDLGHPGLRLQFDVYHRQIMGGDVIRSLERLMPVIGHVQIASVPERTEPGTGELDDARIFGVLDRLGYAGWVGCEYRPAGETRAGLGWRAALR